MKKLTPRSRSVRNGLSKPLGTWLLAGALVAGCAAAPGQAPGAPDGERPGYDVDEGEETPTSARGAEAEFDRAEQELLAVLGDTGGGSGADGMTPYAQPPPPPDEESPAQEPAQPQRAEAYGARTRCGTACRALGSMRRAAAHLCDLAGADDPRCERAEQRVAYAADLVRRSCSTCG